MDAQPQYDYSGVLCKILYLKSPTERQNFHFWGTEHEEMDLEEDPFCGHNLTLKADVCNRTDNNVLFLVVGLPVPLLSIVINAAVITAARLQRKTLRRHNYVFGSVCSTLVSNILYAAMSVWTSIANYLKIIEDAVRPGSDVADGSEILWILRNATIICLLLAMCGNIGSLVFVLLDSTYFVRKKVAVKTGLDANNSAEENRRNRFILTKRRKAHLLIAMSWIVPIVLAVIPAATNWNCLRCCCAPGQYNGDSCSVDAGCSRFWPPMTQSFLEVFLGMWLLEVILLICLLVHTTLKFRKMMSDRGAANESQEEAISDKVQETPLNVDSSDNVPPAQVNTDEPGNTDDKEVNCAVTDQDTCNELSISPLKRSRAASQKIPSFRFKLGNLNPKMKSMIYLSVCFFFFTMSVAVAIIIDIATPRPMPGKDALIIISKMSTYIYTLVCPMILLKFMPKLKLSMIMCFYKCGKIFER